MYLRIRKSKRFGIKSTESLKLSIMALSRWTILDSISKALYGIFKLQSVFSQYIHLTWQNFTSVATEMQTSNNWNFYLLDCLSIFIFCSIELNFCTLKKQYSQTYNITRNNHVKLKIKQKAFLLHSNLAKSIAEKLISNFSIRHV